MVSLWLYWVTGFGEKAYRVPFSSIISKVHDISRIYHCWYELDHLRQCLPDFLTVKLLFFLLPIFLTQWLCEHIQELEIMLRLFDGRAIYINYLKFFCVGDLSFSPFIYLSNKFIYISMDSWMSIYTLRYNPMLLYLFCYCFSVGHWELLHLAPVSLWHTLISVCVGGAGGLNTSLLLAITGFSRLIFYTFCSSHLFKKPRFFLLENRRRNHDLRSRSVSCSWDVISRPSQLTEQRNIPVNSKCVPTFINISIW